MTTLLRALHAESLKLKRTLAFRMVFIAPLLVALLQFFMGLNQRRAAQPGFNLWETIFNASLVIWAIFMLPLLITLETALLAGIEHGEKQWKHLLALPIPRSAVYASKFMIALALTLLSTLTLFGLSLLNGYALIKLRPELASSAPPEFLKWLFVVLKLWTASWLIIAIHTWIGIRWSSLTLALGAGVAGTFFALFAASARIGKFYPWLLPMNSLNLIEGEPRDTLALLIGGLGGVVAFGLGCLEFTRRDSDEPETSMSRRFLLAVGAAGIALAILGVAMQSAKSDPAPPKPSSVTPADSRPGS